MNERTRQGVGFYPGTKKFKGKSHPMKVKGDSILRSGAMIGSSGQWPDTPLHGQASDLEKGGESSDTAVPKRPLTQAGR